MRIRWLATLSLLLGFAALPAIAGDDPAAARLARFLDAHGQQSGLPDEAEAVAMRDFLSTRLAADLAVALGAQREFVADHPDEKPPLVEGPLFNSSAYEPWTAYAIDAGRVDAVHAGPAGADGERRVLRVEFTDDTVTPAIRWHDEFALVREDGTWRVDDVAYRGGFASGNHGTLRDALYGEAASEETPAATPPGDGTPPPSGD